MIRQHFSKGQPNHQGNTEHSEQKKPVQRPWGRSVHGIFLKQQSQCGWSGVAKGYGVGDEFRGETRRGHCRNSCSQAASGGA